MENGLYLSREALIDLGVIPPDFPSIGGSIICAATSMDKCNCTPRQPTPPKPSLPFPANHENRERLEKFLLEYYKASTFNRCTHQVLAGITGPDLKLHLGPDAEPKAVHVPSKVPLHWGRESEATNTR